MALLCNIRFKESKGVTTRLDDPKQIQLQSVITVGEQVKADIEGLAIYKGQVRDYLVISSQGDDSYLIVDAAAPYQLRGKFKISANLNHEIDAVSETDGLEVTSANLGGIWKKGMLVVQDGRKRMPEGKPLVRNKPLPQVQPTALYLCFI